MEKSNHHSIPSPLPRLPAARFLHRLCLCRNISPTLFALEVIWWLHLIKVVFIDLPYYRLGQVALLYTLRSPKTSSPGQHNKLISVVINNVCLLDWIGGLRWWAGLSQGPLCPHHHPAQGSTWDTWSVILSYLRHHPLGDYWYNSDFLIRTESVSRVCAFMISQQNFLILPNHKALLGDSLPPPAPAKSGNFSGISQASGFPIPTWSPWGLRVHFIMILYTVHPYFPFL